MASVFGGVWGGVAAHQAAALRAVIAASASVRLSSAERMIRMSAAFGLALSMSVK